MNELKVKAIWLTGLSGAGKSTIANGLFQKLSASGIKSIILDGDAIRYGINKDLGFSIEDRLENIRRVAEIARLFLSVDIIPICAFISPTEAIREFARQIIRPEEFIELYVSTPLAACEERDVKGLYKKARSGQIHDFTGIHSPFEIPTNPDIEIDTENKSIDATIEECFSQLIQLLRKTH
ncbi:adenylyl-sulfate kinase [Emticicia fontis]